ncbi:MAG: DrmB family protein [Streptosporangiaceae bacterium]
MRLPAEPGGQRFRDPTRIGQARPSHLVSTAGVGAILDLPAMSVIVRGLDAWHPERQDAIDEPRLLAEVRQALGPQVRALRHAPWDPAERDDPYSRVGVPVTPFPRWVRCPRCHRLGALDPPGQFELVHQSGRRPDLAKFVHAKCGKQVQTRDVHRRACVPARFLVVCPDGHLDDFPYVDYVHQGVAQACDGPSLTMMDASSTLGPRVTVRCTECRASRSIQDAAGRDGWAKLPACRGRQPHLQRFVSCGKPLKLIVLGASNLWFGVTASALHLPRGQGVHDLVAANWQVLGAQPSPEVAQAIIDGMDALRGLRGVPMGEVWACVEKIRAAGGPAPEPDRLDLLDAEWQLLSRPTTDRQDADFRAVPTSTPRGYDRLLDQVVLVPRLREVRGLLGFTRLAAPERGDLRPAALIPLSRGAPDWIPAVEQRGEGIFLELGEDAVARWAAEVAGHPRIAALEGAYRRWSHNRGAIASPSVPIARLTLIHTFSHMLIRQVALECGYSSASLRERLYIGTAHTPTAGVLISTAASDSEGTLGGLVALGQARYLKRLLDQAFDDALHCSSDPLCAEHVPIDPSAALHAAACHACLFAAETSCEHSNRWLDRAVLADLTGDGLAFTP